MSAPDRSLPITSPDPVYNSGDLECFMQTYSYAMGLGRAGDVAAGKRLMLDHLEELRGRSEAVPVSLVELWEVGVARYDDTFRPQTNSE